MKTALAGIPALDDGVICELYSFKLKSGAILRYTTHQVDLNWAGHSYLAAPVALSRSTITVSSEDYGLAVNEVDITMYPHDLVNFIGGISLAQFINEGGFDSATVIIYRARRSRVVHLFEGLVTQAAADRIKCELKASNPLMLLNIDMPRINYQPGCRHTVFDVGCTLAKSAYRHVVSVLAGSTTRVLNCSLSQADGYFDLGEVLFTDGDNAGVTRTVKDYSPGAIVLTLPLPFAPAVGDHFDVYPGCNGVRSTCKDKYNNEPNFGGQPYIPVPEMTT